MRGFYYASWETIKALTGGGTFDSPLAQRLTVRGLEPVFLASSACQNLPYSLVQVFANCVFVIL